MPLVPLAATTECVRVVVDYGTFPDSPNGPNTHCTAASYGDTAAEVLARRAGDLHATPPRYYGNFLCALDGYPEGNECGYYSGPYWSFWIYLRGKWTYSSFGVDSYAIGDADKDGHPDPVGFRYQPEEVKASPRSDPGYPSPAPTTTRPPSPTASPRASRTPAPTTPATARSAVRASPSSTAPATLSSASADVTYAAAEPTAPPGIARRAGRGFPVGTALAGLLAAGLLGTAAVRLRRSL